MNVPTAIAKAVIGQNRIDPLKLDNEPLNIHFQNGYWSMELDKFCERLDPFEHLVTKCIRYDFDVETEIMDEVSAALISAAKVSEEELKELVKKEIKKQVNKKESSICSLFSSPAAFNYFRYCMGCSLMNTPLNNFIVFLGTGKNGKSTFTAILSAVFDCYAIALDSDALDTGELFLLQLFYYIS